MILREEAQVFAKKPVSVSTAAFCSKKKAINGLGYVAALKT